MRGVVAGLFLFVFVVLQAQDSTSLSLLFVGDIMGHDTQINAARNPETGKYEYEPTFQYIAPVFQSVDFCIANLEVTLAGEPFAGYPKFSSPDTLADVMKAAGVDVVATSNNHACDRGTEGAVRTIQLLDEKGFQRLGTYLNEEDRKQNNACILEKNGIKLALLNYTYGTNGLRVAAPVTVNYIDSALISADIAAVQDSVDEVVIFFHWGVEYEQLPNALQKGYVNYCHSLGVRYIVGSHPHVTQPIYWENKGNEETFTAYSLGNFVSNQRTHPRDGGALVQMEFTKDSIGNVILRDAGYYLTWVYNPVINERKRFYVLPSASFEANKDFFLTHHYYDKMLLNIESSRTLFNENNVGVRELTWE